LDFNAHKHKHWQGRQDHLMRQNPQSMPVVVNKLFEQKFASLLHTKFELKGMNRLCKAI
jgi:hypothetical protein